MILHINGLRLSLDEGEKRLAAKAAALLSIPESAIVSLSVIRKSLDARRYRPPFFVYALEILVPDDTPLPRAGLEETAVSVAKPGVLPDLEGRLTGKGESPLVRHKKEDRRVLVLGCGPAGLFAALAMAERGVPVLLLERGKELEERRRDVLAFWDQGALNRESNVHFGEGGAGAFSDGKLTSRTKNPGVRKIKETLVACGAQPDILIDAKPHIGTDRLRRVVRNFRKKLLDLGCEIRFDARVSDFLVDRGAMVGLIVNDSEEIRMDHLILAPGQNADDTYRKLRERGVPMEPKPFAMGLRVEHPQELINQIQYGKWWSHAALPPAEYYISARTAFPDRSVYTFCMCPGGRIIGCSSEPGTVITNGMSRSQRDGIFANSAVVVNVRREDFAEPPFDPLAGLAFRGTWEEKAFSLGGANYFAPAQGLIDFLLDRETGKLGAASFRPGLSPALLQEAAPDFVVAALKEGFRQFETRMPGFITEEATLVGVETRTSSPVRILRAADGQSTGVAGLYPCGEGAGYAGGIISSALDGIRAAESLLARRDGRLR